MQWCREPGRELADVAVPPQHTQSQGCHPQVSHPSQQPHQHQVGGGTSATSPGPVVSTNIAPTVHRPRGTPPRSLQTHFQQPALRGTHWAKRCLERTMNLKMYSKALKVRMSGSQGSPRLACSTYCVSTEISFLRVRDVGRAQRLPCRTDPGLSPLPAHISSLSPSLLVPTVLVGERGTEVLADVSLQDGVEVVKLPVGHEPHDENLGRGRMAWHRAAVPLATSRQTWSAEGTRWSASSKLSREAGFCLPGHQRQACRRHPCLRSPS